MIAQPGPHWARPDHHPLPTGSRNDGVGHDGASLNKRPRQSTAPAGLFAPAPEVVAEKKQRPPKVISQAGNIARQKPCGTETASKRHKRNREQCEVCDAARAARRKTNTAPKHAGPVAVGERCGTRLGYEDHLKRDEGTCQPCKDAMSADARRRYAARRAATLPPTKTESCGKYSGRQAHRRRGERPCNACRLARAEAERDAA